MDIEQKSFAMEHMEILTRIFSKNSKDIMKKRSLQIVSATQRYKGSWNK